MTDEERLVTLQAAMRLVGETLAENPPGNLDDYDKGMLIALMSKDKAKGWINYFILKARGEINYIEEKGEE